MSIPVRIYLCECGPIIKDAVDLDALTDSLSTLEGIEEIRRYPTLCSNEGKEWLAQDIRSHPASRIVIAGCSPREHEATFRQVCREAGINPYLMTLANIREQCTWVTPHSEQARQKSFALIRAALNRVRSQMPLDEREVECNTDVLVVGAGVAGLTAARMLAEADRKVILVDRSPAVGGTVGLLGDVYPSLECASCMLEPLMDEVLHHEKIEVVTHAQVQEILGYLGNFEVSVLERTRRVDPNGCYGCSTCHAACPVEVPRECDHGLSKRKAIYIPYEGALPNVSLIDENSCLALNGQPCDECVKACPFGNIDLNAVDEVIERKVGAVIVATGAEVDKTEPDQLPEGVITTMALERLINSSGPTSGEIRLPGREEIRSLALIQCVDEGCRAPSSSCSKICCMSFAKYVQQIREKLPECEIHQLLWERCAGGKGYREFSLKSDRTERLYQVWLGRSDSVAPPVAADDRVLVSYTAGGADKRIEVDMAVLAPPLTGQRSIEPLAAMLRVDLDAQGFLVEENEHLSPFKTRVQGVQVAGCARGPADIQDSAAQGAAAAGGILASLVPGRKIRVEAATASVDPSRCGGCHTCILTCPYKAVTWDASLQAASVNDVLCRGCGSCAAACPTGAIEARHFSDDQIGAEIAALAEDARSRRER